MSLLYNVSLATMLLSLVVLVTMFLLLLLLLVTVTGTMIAGGSASDTGSTKIQMQAANM